MPVSGSLKHFLCHFSVAERIPLPASEEWKEHVEHISVPGRIAEVTEEHYFYWLEVLPPKYLPDHFWVWIHYGTSNATRVFLHRTAVVHALTPEQARDIETRIHQRKE